MTKQIIHIVALAVATKGDAPNYEVFGLLEDGKTVVALVSGDEYSLDDFEDDNEANADDASADADSEPDAVGADADAAKEAAVSE